ncbi:MAG: helix-hairpin-helix domain-containing protein [Bacilli bacterium]|nr:helix-hairpin-helix domain-containing protein [Bacilli bacterium]
MYKTILAIVAVTVILIVVMAVVDRVSTEIVTVEDSTIITYSAPETLEVTITGEVTHSGTYYVPLDSSLSTLFQYAGGLTSNADPRAYVTSHLLTNRETIYIAPVYDNSDTCAADPIEKVNVNTATKEELSLVAAFSSTVRENIVSYRETSGEFETLEQLKNVKGIGNATFEKCKNFVYLHS